MGSDFGSPLNVPQTSERLRGLGAPEQILAFAGRALSSGEYGFLAGVSELVPSAVLAFDAEGRLILQNPAAEHLWPGPEGVEREFAKCRAFSADGSVYERSDWPLAKCLQSLEPVLEQELHVRRFDGAYMVLSASAAPVFDAKGRLCGAIAVFSDVTRLKGFEAAERLRSQRMQRIQALTADLASALTSEQVAECIIDHGVAVLGAENGAIWAIEAPPLAMLLRQSGYSEAARNRYAEIPLDGDEPVALAMARREAVFIETPEDLLQRFPVFAEQARGIINVESMSFACLPLVVGTQSIGGLAFAFDGAHTFDPDERAFLSLLADNCAKGLHRARSYEAEQHARAQMALLFGVVNAVNSATSLEDVYTPALTVVEQVLGVQRSAILLYDADGMMRFKSAHGLSQSYRDAVEGHSPWAREVRNPCSLIVSDTETDESVAAYREILRAEGIRALAFIPLYHHKLLGKFMVYSPELRAFSSDELSLIESIANQVAQAVARKLSEAEVARLFADAQQARAAAEAASRMKDEFLAVVSHELRTPLTAISGWAAVLKGERRNDPVTLCKGLDVIERNARVQTKIIEDILDVSRIVTGKLRLEPRPVSLAHVVSEALDSVRTSAQAKDIDLHFELPDDPHGVIGDSARLRQIVWNLLSNAIKFTPQGGRVEIALRRRVGMTELEVTDSGKGIEREFLPYVFERFRQADSSTTRMQGGLGLGLAIVRHLVELHGGQVRAESAGIGKGARFVVAFPVRAVFVPSDQEDEDDEDVSAEQQQAAEAAVDLSGLRVLLVDDEPDARELLREVLMGFGADVETAESVDTALATLSGFEPHVLVSDIGMPEQDGYALIRRVRNLAPPLNRVPAIALTAYARHEDARRALNAGFQGYLPKPTDPLTLATAVATAHRVGLRDAL